jgi:ATP-dependent exoDNAse (exonuclease V) beta subunit
MVGTVVHRLLQSHLANPASDERLRASALAVLRPAERTQLGDERAVIDAAVARYRALASQPELREALAQGTAQFEVPFSLRLPDAIVRGAIDCLVEKADGSVLVLEFKTGTRSPEHDRQLEIYLSAARALFPGSAVEGRVLYP